MEEIKATYLDLSWRSPGVLYEPAKKNDKQRIAVLNMHSDEDYLNWVTGPELAKRGYTVLNANVKNKEGIVYSQAEKTQCVKVAVEYLRSLPQVEKIVLMGHSGGGTLMSAYQALAENGAGIFQGPEMIFPYSSDEILPPADGIMLLDSNWGNAVMQLLSLDPAVENENSGMFIDESLNLFNPENGFDPAGSHYSKEFIRKFQAAQSTRNVYILEYALSRLAKIEAGEGNYIDDEPLIIPGSAQGFFNNKLYAQDTSLMSHTQNAYTLLHPDGSRTTEVIHSLRGPENPDSLTDNFWDGARFLSVKTYLNSYAVRTTDDYGFDEDHLWGVEWESTYNCPPGNMKHVHVPTLVMGMTAGWEFLASETIYNMAAASDKTTAYVEGATHKFTPATYLETYEGEFGDTVKTLHDYLDEWLSAGRF